MLLTVALGLMISACGGGEGPAISGDDLRACLAGQGFSVLPERPGTGASNLSPDFSASLSPDGAILDVALEKNPERAEAAAADARSALRTFGIEDADGALIQSENAVLLFEDPPSTEERAAVEACV